MSNLYVPELVKIVEIVKHNPKEWTFRAEVETKGVKSGQFYEISMPKHGESPISVSGIDDNCLDFTIRAVGRVTEEIFKLQVGDSLRLRGPYGNGFNVEDYEGKEIIVVAGGSGLAPVRGIMEYFYNNLEKCKNFTLICGFKSTADILFKDDIKKWSEKFNVIQTIDKEEEGYEGYVGLVTQYIPDLKIDDLSNVAAIAVGPPIMMKFTVAEFEKKNIQDKDIWVSYERKMSCGLGKCGHCKMDSTYICVDGPVFNYSFGKTLFD